MISNAWRHKGPSCTGATGPSGRECTGRTWQVIIPFWRNSNTKFLLLNTHPHKKAQRKPQDTNQPRKSGEDVTKAIHNIHPTSTPMPPLQSHTNARAHQQMFTPRKIKKHAKEKDSSDRHKRPAFAPK
jgi:hypothetical protein